jgi:hypothetical protein
VIVTVKERLALLPAASLVEQLTVVTPAGKAVPEGGLHTGARGPSQLSIAVAVKLTMAEQSPASFDLVIACGQVIAGA